MTRPYCHSVYLEPRCKNPKKSRAQAEYVKYLPVPVPARSMTIIFSTNLDPESRTPTPCNINNGENITGRGID
ncbi:hypothetical protein Hanom_Chr05g00451121 [Helianthus anomalus]